jgi:hypothetical protein
MIPGGLACGYQSFGGTNDLLLRGGEVEVVYSSEKLATAYKIARCHKWEDERNYLDNASKNAITASL